MIFRILLYTKKYDIIGKITARKVYVKKKGKHTSALSINNLAEFLLFLKPNIHVDPSSEPTVLKT
jgi:hypothetical protein